MNSKQLIDAICKYRNMLKACNVKSAQYPSKHLNVDKYCAVQHCCWMLDKMENMLEADPEGRWAKLMRWLGFVQGILWVYSIYTIDQLKEDNRGITKI